MPPVTAPPRSELDDEALKQEMAQEAGEDDGLGPDSSKQAPPVPEDNGGAPPTPPANLPGDEPDDDDVEEDEKGLRLIGDRELGLKVGGRKPDGTTLKFKGAKVDLGAGQFDRETRIRTVDVWQVTGDNNQDTIDTASGEVKSTSKVQSATLCGTERVEKWLLDRLQDSFDADAVKTIFTALDLELPAE